MDQPHRISLEKCRHILGEGAKDQTGQELRELRERLYEMANGVLDRLARATTESRTKPTVSNLDEALPLLSENDQEALQERAAIRVFDGEMERDEAERVSLGEVLIDEVN